LFNFASKIVPDDKMSEDLFRYFNVKNSELFKARFCTEDDCYALLADLKWKNGFRCRHCGHTNFCRGKSPHSRRCTKCKREESATAHTIFHHCRIPLKTAFEIAFQVCNNPEISTYKLSDSFEHRQMTCWKFKKRVLECKDKGLDALDFTG